METYPDELMVFFETFVDVERLKIVGELAKGHDRVHTLATQMGLESARVITHLRKLSQTGVVSLKALGDGDYAYEINSEALEEMAIRQFSRAKKLNPRFKDQRHYPANFSDEERKILKNYTNSRGEIKQIPLQYKKQQILLRYVLQAIDAGKVYTEKEINLILKQYNRDVAFLRRGLVDLGYLARHDDGSAYWRVEKLDESTEGNHGR